MIEAVRDRWRSEAGPLPVRQQPATVLAEAAEAAQTTVPVLAAVRSRAAEEAASAVEQDTEKRAERR
jgi:F0F1-type ATP synthase epsilon subunit